VLSGRTSNIQYDLNFDLLDFNFDKMHKFLRSNVKFSESKHSVDFKLFFKDYYLTRLA